MKVLYLGSGGGTSGLRFQAFKRLGVDVHNIDPHEALPKVPFIDNWCYKTGALGMSSLVCRYVLSRILHHTYDIVFVDGGELIGPALVRALKKIAGVVLNYNLDNPFTKRDEGRWGLLLKALPEYDLFITPRHSTVTAAKLHGVKFPVRLVQAADEIAHRPLTNESGLEEVFRSKVVFAGTWMPERGIFMKTLIDFKVPIKIFGSRWDRAPEYSALSGHVYLGGLNPSDYAKAIGGSKIAIAMLSKGNADLHTTRSLEIPAVKRLLCGERTSEHLELYEDGIEAVFWADAVDCAKKCLELLANPARIDSIAAAGYARVYKNQNFNEPTLRKIINLAKEVGHS